MMESQNGCLCQSCCRKIYNFHSQGNLASQLPYKTYVETYLLDERLSRYVESGHICEAESRRCEVLNG